MYSCYYWTCRWGRRLFVVLRISQPCALFASLVIYKRFVWTPLPLGSSWRYRLGVALSIDIPYLRALFIALSLMVQVVASLLFFCLFVFSSFLSFSLLFIGKLFLLDEETLVVLHQSSVAFCSFSSQEKSDCQGGHRYCFGSFNWI